MTFTLSFRTKHNYDTTKIGITVPVELTTGKNVVQVDAKLDTGANFCIFERAYGDMLDLKWRVGQKRWCPLRTARFTSSGTGLR